MSDRTSSRLWWGVVAIIFVAGALGVFFWLRHRDEPDNGGRGDSTDGIAAEQTVRLLELKNLAIGHLENNLLEEAIKEFETIARELPEEPLGTRNLAISRVLALEQVPAEWLRTEPGKFAKFREQAENAVKAATAKEPKSAVPHIIAARMWHHLADVDFGGEDFAGREIAALKTAADLNPDSAHIWYELYNIQNLQRDDATRAEAIASLKRAYKLRPGNLAVLHDTLKSQAAAKDPAVLQTLKSARGVVTLIATRLRKENSQYKLLDLFEKALAGIQADKNEAWFNVPFVANILNGRHAARLDRREMRPHLLEFVLHDYSDRFYERADVPQPEMAAGIPVTFQPAGEAWQLPPLQNVRAVRVFDFDLDGRNDIVVLAEKQVRVFGRTANARNWSPIARAELPFPASGIIAVDLDFDVTRSGSEKQAAPDGKASPAKKAPTKKAPAKQNPSANAACATADVDLVVWGAGGVVVLRNEIDPQSGLRRLQNVEQPAGFQKLKEVIALTAADIDHDRDLDLIVSTESGMALWSNLGDMTFFDATPFSQLPPAALKPQTLVPLDFDRNVFIDVVVGNPNGEEAGYLQNIGHGQLRYKKFGAKFAPLGKALRLLPIEADGNASWDWLAAGGDGITLTTTRTVDHGRYRFQKSTQIHSGAVDGATLLDYDNDGYQDLLAFSADGFVVYRGGPQGAFQKTDGLFPDNLKGISQVAVGDLDHDGDLDVIAVASGKPVLLLNEGGNKNHWIAIQLRAQGEDVQFLEQRCNIHGVGSLMELKAGTSYQARVVSDPVTHFGLGDRKQADVVRVVWTNGIPQNEMNPGTRQTICSPQKLLKGSCPYLYTWDGERYVFLTDLLWAAPIGLQFADGVIAPAREWEYLKIPGEKLAAVDGEYRMHITEELWEAGYFDSVKLYAIDHPADVEIHTNEKVGPAAIAPLKVHTVREPRLPVAARDQTGRDVLPLVARRDGKFLQAYRSRLTQGLTPEHFLELDLGKLGKPKQIKLFLTGWVFPTDTSINVWLSQHPKMPAPQPPSVWVPDENGKWTKSIPYMGFPGGKTKTIVVDLSRAFLTDDYRLRIRTTMELRWDAVFFTVDEEPAPYRMTELPLLSAQLSYRGFSKRTERPHHAPETYDFHNADRVPRWPPMAGRFTRYGDVTELVRDDDHRLVVMGAGDTMALSFRQSPRQPLNPPLPAGWKRDFFIRNVGWDKDADLNTVLGQTVEPLPFRGMKRYPFAPDDVRPNSREFRDYLRRYQTRRQPAAHFWHAIRNLENSTTTEGSQR